MDAREKEETMNGSGTDESFGSIAVIGMAGRFPGAGNIEAFWRNLLHASDSVKSRSDDQLAAAGTSPVAHSSEKRVKAKGVLEGVELFDASFFEMSSREASLMDPQHRLFLMCAWEAIEDAGYDPALLADLVGIFGGKAESQYLIKNVIPQEGFEAWESSQQFRMLNASDFLTAFTAYKLNLRGPSVNVQAADSTSLVALSLACQSLLSYQCDVALGGGVSFSLPSLSGPFAQAEDSAAADGSGRASDDEARGAVRGSGVGIVVLKRLAEAIAVGDHIYAVIKGSAINTDGGRKESFSSPSIDGQAEVIVMAQALAGVEPETVTYIEANGIGSPIRDAGELAALAQVFRAGGKKKGFCGVGSVKTNIGHLDAAVGMAGFIKTVLALKHKTIPPGLPDGSSHPAMDVTNSPFYIVKQRAEWSANGVPRRAGVNSFGMSGVNAHVVLEESPVTEPSAPARPFQLILLSAKSEGALERATDNLAAHLRQHPEQSLADVAYTLQTGRRRFAHRRLLVCRDAAEGVAELEARNPRRVLTSVQETSQRPIAFMFSGLGNHYIDMARDLYRTEPVFRQEMDRCCELLKPHLGRDLREILYPAAKDNGTTNPTTDPDGGVKGFGLDLRKMLRRGEGANEVSGQLNQSLYSQPALFCLEYALARLWMAWGIRPDALIGYSIGEYVAACLAGVFSLEDALRLVAARARMIQELPGGAMLAIPLSEEEVQPLLNHQLSLSASNGPNITVVGGPIEAITDLQQKLTQEGLACQRLQVAHAFHSQMMAPILESFIEMARGVKLNPPQLPYLSNVTGGWITAEQAQDPNYWGEHLCKAVRFADGVQELWKKPGRILLEVGPGQALCAWAMQQPENGHEAERVALPSLRHSYEEQSDVAFINQTLGRLWLSGAQIDWPAFHQPEPRRRVSLPTYSFDLERHWIEPRNNFAAPTPTQAAPEPEPQVARDQNTPERAALPQRKQPATPYAAPRNELEEKLSEIWRRTLKLERVGIYDNFFALGGDSIRATQFITHVNQAFFVALSLREFFNSPSVAEVAVIVVQKQAEQTNTESLAQMLKEIKQLSEDEGESHPPTEEASN